MERRLFLATLIGGAVVAAGGGMTAAQAAGLTGGDMTSVDAVRGALGGEPTEMQRHGHGGRGGMRGGGRFHGGGGFRRGWGGGPRWGYRRGWGPRPWGPRPWGPRPWRRCWINRWGERVCRPPVW